MTAAQRIVTTDPIDPQDSVRADFYGLLGHLFYAAPDAGLLRALADSGELDAEASGAGLPVAWNVLRRASGEATAEAVRAEYDDTFIGVGKPRVMLYASYYLAGFLNEKPLAELRDDLAALGLARSGEAKEPEDHLSGLVDVMRQLILDERSAQAEREAAQQRFFFRYIEPCYGRLCDAIEDSTEVVFYRSVAGFARAFLDVEKEFFTIGQLSS
jgi:TorA maturation chaperone TorD